MSKIPMPLSDNDPRHGERGDPIVKTITDRLYGDEQPLSERATVTRNVEDTAAARIDRREHRRQLRDKLIVALVGAAGTDFHQDSTGWVVEVAEAVARRAYAETS